MPQFPVTFTSSAAQTVTSGATFVVNLTVDFGPPLFTISGGADAAKFSVDSASGLLQFIAAPNFAAPSDANVDNVYEVTIGVTVAPFGVGSQSLLVTVIASSFDISAPVVSFTNRVIYDISAPTVNLTNRVINDISTPVVNFTNRVFAPFSPSVSFTNIINAAELGSRFKLMVMLGGVDMSAPLTGDVRVPFGGSEARLVEFTLMPFSGVIDPYAWIDSSVTINVLTFDSAGSQLTNNRIFTGKVDVPVYDPSSGLTKFECTDGLQQSFEAQTFDQIALQIGGRYSDVCKGEPLEDEKWPYAQDRMDSMPASFQFDSYGVLKKGDWQAKATADITLNDGDIIHDSIDLSLVSSRRLINAVNINFNVRYARKWQREIGGEWIYPRTFSQYLSENTTLPNRQMVLDSLASQWLLKSVKWTKLPPSGNYFNAESDEVSWVMSDSLRQQLIFGAGFVLSRRWLQDVTENYSIQVKSPASIGVNGVVAEDVSYAFDFDVDDDFEGGLNQQSSTGITDMTDDIDTEKGYEYAPPQAGSIAIDATNYILDPAERAEYDNAILTAQDLAKVRVLKSHRDNTVSCATLFNPDIDCTKTVSINHSKVVCKGVVKSGEHVFDVLEGIAHTHIDVAIYQPNIPAQADDLIAVPGAPNVTPDVSAQQIVMGNHFGGKAEVPFDEEWQGYVGNWTTREFPSEWYSEQFRVDIPAVEEAARDAQEFSAESSINIAIPQDNLIITAG